MELTLRLIAWTETLLIGLRPRSRKQSEFRERLLRINEYLCKRANRDETPEEQEAYSLIWPPLDLGGEG